MIRKQKSPIRSKVLSSLTRAFSGKKEEVHQEVAKQGQNLSNIQKKSLLKLSKEEYQHSVNRSVDEVLGFSQPPARSYRLNRSKQTQEKSKSLVIIETPKSKVVEQKKQQQKQQGSSQRIVQSRCFVKEKRLTLGQSRAIQDQKSQVSQTSRARTSKAEQNMSLFNLTESEKQMSNELTILKQQMKESNIMKLSEQARQALKKVQIYDKFAYGSQSTNICGQILTNQVKRLQKIKNAQKQMRTKYYDNQLTITALHYHVKFMTQIMKKQKDLTQLNRQLKQKNQITQKSQSQLIKKSYKKQEPSIKVQQVANAIFEQQKDKLIKLQEQLRQKQILLAQKQVQLQKFVKGFTQKDQQIETIKHALARLKQESQKKDKESARIKKQFTNNQNQLKKLQNELKTVKSIQVQTSSKQQKQKLTQKDHAISSLEKEIQKLKQFQASLITFVDSFGQKLSFKEENSSSFHQQNNQSKESAKSRSTQKRLQRKSDQNSQTIAVNVSNFLQQQKKLRINFPQQKSFREIIQPFAKPLLSKNPHSKNIIKMMDLFINFLQTSKKTQNQIVSVSQKRIQTLQKQMLFNKTQFQKLLNLTKRQNEKQIIEIKRQSEKNNSQQKKQHEIIQRLYEKLSQQNIKLKQSFAQTLTQLQENIAKTQNYDKKQTQLGEVYAKLQKQYLQRGKHITKIKALEQELISYKSMKKQHQKQLQKVHQQYKKWQMQKDNAIKTHQKQLNLIKQQKLSLQSRIKELSEQLEHYRIEYEEEENKTRKLTTQVREYNNKIKSFQGSSQKMTKQNQKILQQKLKTIQRRQEQISILTKLKEQNHHQIQKLSITVRSKTNQLQQISNMMIQIQNKLSHAEQKHEQLHKTYSENTHKILELTLINKQQQIQLKSAKKQNQSLQLSKLNLSKQIQKYKERQVKSKQKVSQLQSNLRIQVAKSSNLQKQVKVKEKEVLESKLTYEKSLQKLKNQKEDIVMKKQLLQESYKKLQFMIKQQKIQSLSNKQNMMQTKTKAFIEELESRNVSYIQKMHTLEVRYQEESRHLVQKYQAQLKQFYQMKNQKHHLQNLYSQLSKKVQIYNEQANIYENQEQLLKTLIFYIRNTPKTIQQLEQLFNQLNQQFQGASNQINSKKFYYLKQLIQQVFALQKKYLEGTQKSTQYLRIYKNNQNQLRAYKQCLTIVNQVKKVVNQDSTRLSLPFAGSQVSYTVSYQPFFIHSLQSLISIHRHSNNNEYLSQVIQLLHGLWTYIKNSSRAYSQSLKQFDSNKKFLHLQYKQKIQKLEYNLPQQEQSFKNDFLHKLNQKQKRWQEKMFLQASQYDNKISQMKAQIQKFMIQINNLQETVKMHSNVSDDSKYRTENDAHNMLKLKQQMQWLQFEKDSLTTQLSKAQKRIHTQKGQITNLQQGKELLQQKIIKLKQNNMKIMYSQRFLKQSMEELNTEIRLKNNQINKLLLSKQAIQRSYAHQLQNSSQSFMTKIQQLETVNSLLNIKISNFEQQMTKVLTQNSNIDSKLQQSEYTNEKLRQKIEQQVSNYEQLSSKFNILLNQYDPLNQQFQEMKIKSQNTVISLQQQVCMLKRQLQQTYQKRDNLSKQNKRLNGNIYILNNQIKQIVEMFRREEIDHYNHSSQCMLKDKTEIQILKKLYTEIDYLVKQNQAYKLKFKRKNANTSNSSLYQFMNQDVFQRFSQFICEVSQSLKLSCQNNITKLQNLQSIIKKYKLDKFSDSLNYQYSLLSVQRFITTLEDTIIQLISVSSNLSQPIIKTSNQTIIHKTVKKQSNNEEIIQRNKQNLKMLKHSPIQNILAMSERQQKQQQHTQKNSKGYQQSIMNLNFDRIVNLDQSVIQKQQIQQTNEQDKKMLVDFQQLFEDVRYLVIQYQKSNNQNEYIELLNRSLGIKTEDLQITIPQQNY